MTPFRPIYSLILVLLFSVSSKAFQVDHYALGYGLLNSNLFKEAVGDDGSSSFLGSFNFHFLNGEVVWRTFGLDYQARVAHTIIPRESVDDSADITQTLVSFRAGKKLANPSLTWYSGLGILRTKSKGNGGSVELNNGGGTATFFRPSNTTSSQLLMIETGLAYKYSPHVLYAIDLLANGLFGEKRNFNVFFNVSYVWPQNSYAPRRVQPRLQRRPRRFQ